MYFSITINSKILEILIQTIGTASVGGQPLVCLFAIS